MRASCPWKDFENFNYWRYPKEIYERTCADCGGPVPGTTSREFCEMCEPIVNPVPVLRHKFGVFKEGVTSTVCDYKETIQLFWFGCTCVGEFRDWEP